MMKKKRMWKLLNTSSVVCLPYQLRLTRRSTLKCEMISYLGDFARTCQPNFAKSIGDMH